MGRYLILQKSFIHGHYRTGQNGQLVFVNPYMDARHKKPDFQTPHFASPPPQAVLSPEEDYAQNGTHAAAFLAWFGDWDSDPEGSSKVVGKDGEPLQVYPRPESLAVGEDGMPVLVRHDGKGEPFGPAFYFTTSPSASALEKAKPDPFQVTTPYRHHVLQQAHGVLTKYNAQIDPEQAGMFLQHGDLRMLQPDTTHPSMDDLQQAHTGLTNAPAPPCYLNIRNPLKMAEPLDAKEIMRLTRQDPPLVQALSGAVRERTGLGAKAWPQSAVGGDIFAALGNTDREAEAPHILSGMGYDGVQDRDGWVAFHAEQVKAAQNTGTFDPNSDDMYKAAVDADTPPEQEPGALALR